MPDSLETRVARLEQRLEDTIVRMDARLIDLASDARALRPLVVAHAEMAVKLTTAVEEARAAHLAVDHLEERLSARDDAQRQERKKDRWALIGVVVAASGLIVGALQVLLG